MEINLKDFKWKQQKFFLESAKGIWIQDVYQTGMDSGFLIQDTEEKRLTSLGTFPLPQKHKDWLIANVTDADKKFRIPPIFQESDIPLFIWDQKNQNLIEAFLPEPTLAIARYFSQVWQENVSPEDEVLNGFYILFSFYGGTK